MKPPHIAVAARPRLLQHPVVCALILVFAAAHAAAPLSAQRPPSHMRDVATWSDAVLVPVRVAPAPAPFSDAIALHNLSLTPHRDGAPAGDALLRDGPGVPRLLGGGIVGGAAGALALGFAGAWIGGNRCTDPGNPDSCAPLGGLLIGALVGQSAGIPIGVHLAGGRRGRLAPALAASAVAAAAGAVLIAQLDDDAGRIAIVAAIPVTQLITSVLIERRGSGRMP